MPDSGGMEFDFHKNTRGPLAVDPLDRVYRFTRALLLNTDYRSSEPEWSVVRIAAVTG